MAKRATTMNQQFLNSKGFDENDWMMGMMLLQKPGNDLIQNCDLPPPVKVFSGSDNKTVISSMNRKKEHNFVGGDQEGHDINDRDQYMGILKALRLSQTRAREAEAKHAAIAKERDMLVLAFMEDSMQILGYQQLVRLLEFQVSQLQQQQQQQKQVCCECGKRDKGDGDEGDDGSGSKGLTWVMAVALCLGIAGFGFAIGCKYLYF